MPCRYKSQSLQGKLLRFMMVKAGALRYKPRTSRILPDSCSQPWSTLGIASTVWQRSLYSRRALPPYKHHQSLFLGLTNFLTCRQSQPSCRQPWSGRQSSSLRPNAPSMPWRQYVPNSYLEGRSLPPHFFEPDSIVRAEAKL